jgi:glycosyltransferase involved in cell wall biosynthesis
MHQVNLNGYRQKRILFVHNDLWGFVQTDRDLFAERYTITERYERPLYHIRPLGLWREVAAHDLVFCWFASWHSLLPVLFARVQGKPSVVVIGGYDVANMPAINYGHQRWGWNKWIGRVVMNSATILLAFSHHGKEEAIRNVGLPYGRVQVIYLGVSDPFVAVPQGDRRTIVLTVGNVCRDNLLRKGHEPFVQAAAHLPNVEFVLVGRWLDSAIDYLRAMAPSNVTFTGWVSEEKLLDYYREASVYVQASAHEGFGLSVAEAMLAGCIPVVTRVGSLPEVVDNCGIYIPSNQPQDVAAAIRQALTLSDSIRQRARQRIQSMFPLSHRRQALYALIDSLIGC